MNTRLRTVVFPVAGLGTRFLPATKVIPKEMLPVMDRPLIQWASDEAVAAGADTLVFVVNRNKRAISDHYDQAFELEQKLAQSNKLELLRIVRDVLPDHVRPVEEVAETLARLQAKGKTRAIGFSEIAPATLRQAAAVVHVDAVQSEYSLQTRAPELGLVQACAELGTALVAFSPVGRSLLTDHPIQPGAVAGIAFLKSNPRFAPGNHAANLAITDRFRALAAEMGVPSAGLACAWAWRSATSY